MTAVVTAKGAVRPTQGGGCREAPSQKGRQKLQILVSPRATGNIKHSLTVAKDLFTPGPATPKSSQAFNKTWQGKKVPCEEQTSIRTRLGCGFGVSHWEPEGTQYVLRAAMEEVPALQGICRGGD